MDKQELIAEIIRKANISDEEAEKALQCIIGSISEAMKNGDDVYINSAEKPITHIPKRTQIIKKQSEIYKSIFESEQRELSNAINMLKSS